jgi:deoxyribodipyrimidine photo-lyase
MTSALIWFCRDLRLSDHPALHNALVQGYKPVPVYIQDEPPTTSGEASRWWLHHSLVALRKNLQRLGSDLLILRGDSATSLLDVAEDTGARAVFWNRRYEPAAVARDRRVRTVLVNAGLEVSSFSAALLREPRELVKADNRPYRVFTPFWKALQKSGSPRAPLAAPAALPPIKNAIPGKVGIEALKLLPAVEWHSQFHAHWQPGESAARSRLDGFLMNGILDYSRYRDRPALRGTSRLSPHLHFGEITPAQVWHSIHDWAANETTPGAIAAAESYLRQIAWREFAHHLLFHFPHTAEEPMDPRYLAFPWQRDVSGALECWQKGETGIPMVDAGMRELRATGWMHNRVRMICASLLTKNLLIPWQEGARWFRGTLVDADLASNSFGWQWTAGCGADAAPYFRIFNPVSQGERFDNDGGYVRRWVPELRQLSAKWVHKPWEAPGDVLSSAGVILGKNYPRPVVDLKQSRVRALEAWDRARQAGA